MHDRSRAVAEGILFTDQYQLTMAQLYFRAGLHEMDVQFDHFFRSYPDYGSHQAGYCINAGLETFLAWMQKTGVRDKDVEYLRSQRNSVGEQIFADDFLEWFRQNGDFSGLTIRAIPEGRVVHPNTALTVVQGPLAMAQIVETALLNMLNYETLVATKAARIVESGRGRPILEFGLRRAQGKGANEGTRAALIGGADFSSNVGMSHVIGLPPKGTHAHSMVQLFMALGMGEIGAFRAYADLYPDDCLLLVDTIDTLESGVPNAIRVFEELKRKGHKPVGIRLDSGDQAYLSIQAAKQLNEAGFPDTAIVLSSDLDEIVIWQIITQISQEAPRYGLDADEVIGRLVYGVGTRLVTSWGDPALGGVYKLVAVLQNGDLGLGHQDFRHAGQDAQSGQQAAMAALRQSQQGHGRSAGIAHRRPWPIGADPAAPSHGSHQVSHRAPGRSLRHRAAADDSLCRWQAGLRPAAAGRDPPPARCGPGAARPRHSPPGQPSYLPCLAFAAVVGSEAGVD